MKFSNLTLYIILSLLLLFSYSNLQSQTKTVRGKIENYDPSLAKARVSFRLSDGNISSSKISSDGTFSFNVPNTQKVSTGDFAINPVTKFKIISSRLGDGNIQIYLSLEAKVKKKVEEDNSLVVTQARTSTEEPQKRPEEASVETSVEESQAEEDISEPESIDTTSVKNTEKPIEESKTLSSSAEMLKRLDNKIDNLNAEQKNIQELRNEIDNIKSMLANNEIPEEEKNRIRERLTALEAALKQLLENYKNIHQDVKNLVGIQENFMARYSRYLLSILLFLILFIFLAYYFFVVARREKKRKEEIAEQKEELVQQAEELQQLTEEIKTQRDALEKQKTYLEQVQKSKDKLTRSVVHDLKHPLGAVLTSDNFDEIHSAGKRMEAYITDMLNIQKYSETSFPITIQDNNLYQIAQSAINTLKPIANKKGVKISNQIAGDTFAKFDINSITRVFENLLSNAIKYTPSGGNIVFRADFLDDKYQVSIKDTGIGIATDKFEEIFEPFMQLDARKFADISSTGIGLTFCKMAVEAHQSNIQVQSQEGQGSEFIFSLEQGKTPQSFVADSVIEPEEENISNIELNDEDKNFLESYITDIKKIAWFKTKQLSQAIEEIPAHSENIVSWKQELLQTCENRNRAGFTKLLNIN